VIAPSAEWRARARANDEGIYARAARILRRSGRVCVRARVDAAVVEVLDWQPPHVRWFVDGQLNVSVNCLDRHVRTARRNKAALIWEGEPAIAAR